MGNLSWQNKSSLSAPKQKATIELFIKPMYNSACEYPISHLSVRFWIHYLSSTSGQRVLSQIIFDLMLYLPDHAPQLGPDRL